MSTPWVLEGFRVQGSMFPYSLHHGPIWSSIHIYIYMYSHYIGICSLGQVLNMQACSGDPRYSMPIAYEMQVQLPDLRVVSFGSQKLCQDSHDRIWATGGSGQVWAVEFFGNLPSLASCNMLGWHCSLIRVTLLSN